MFRFRLGSWRPGCAVLLLVVGCVAQAALLDEAKQAQRQPLSQDGDDSLPRTTPGWVDGDESVTAGTSTAADEGEATTLAAVSGLAESDAALSAMLGITSGDASEGGGSVKKNAPREMAVKVESAGAVQAETRNGIDGNSSKPVEEISSGSRGDRKIIASAVQTNGTRVRFPMPSELAGDDGVVVVEDFMEDMQEMEAESDMMMAERSAGSMHAMLDGDDDNALKGADDVEEEVATLPPADTPVPANHRPIYSSVKGLASKQNAIAKQSKYATAPPPDAKKYEMMMANLPVRDYSLTGREQPLNVVFVFPHVKNETRKKELEVVLVFPQNKTMPGRGPAAASGSGRGKERDIYKKYADKYSSRRSPPSSSILRPDIQNVQRSKLRKAVGAATHVEDDPLETGASELHGVSSHPGLPMRPIVVPSFPPPPAFVQRRQGAPSPGDEIIPTLHRGRPRHSPQRAPSPSPPGMVVHQRVRQRPSPTAEPFPAATRGPVSDLQQEVVFPTDLKRTRSRKRPSTPVVPIRDESAVPSRATYQQQQQQQQNIRLSSRRSPVIRHRPTGASYVSNNVPTGSVAAAVGTTTTAPSRSASPAPAHATVDAQSMRQKLASLQRMLVGKLLSIQKDLDERTGRRRPGAPPVRRPTEEELAEEGLRRNAVLLRPTATPRPAGPVKRYRRPPVYRARTPSPAETTHQVITPPDTSSSRTSANIGRNSITSLPATTAKYQVQDQEPLASETAQPSHSGDEKDVPYTTVAPEVQAQDENVAENVIEKETSPQQPLRGVPAKAEDEVAGGGEESTSVRRDDRSTATTAFRPPGPAQLQGGFHPITPSQGQAAGSLSGPLIVGPIPQGYREVAGGMPVQLELPHPGQAQPFQQPQRQQPQYQQPPHQQPQFQPAFRTPQNLAGNVVPAPPSPVPTPPSPRFLPPVA